MDLYKSWQAHHRHPTSIDFDKLINTPYGIMAATHQEYRPGSDQMSEGTAATAVTNNSAYAETGAPINRSATAEALKESNSALKWSQIRRYCREPLSEFMGVCVFGSRLERQNVERLC